MNCGEESPADAQGLSIGQGSDGRIALAANEACFTAAILVVTADDDSLHLPAASFQTYAHFLCHT